MRLNPAHQRLLDRWFPPGPWPNAEARIKAELAALLAFTREACKTKDEQDPDKPIKPIPLDEVEYIRLYFECLLRNWLVIVPKSRQIMITWATFVYALWLLMRFEQRTWALVPKKKEDGEAHVEDRIRSVLWEYQPPWLKALYELEEGKGTFHLLTFMGQPWRSRLVVYPQGADQLRQFTHSGIIWDEAAHQPRFEAAWMGAAPTILGRGEKRGQVIVISSAKRGSYMQRMCGPQLKSAVETARRAWPEEGIAVA